jgi:hypothetical protein
MIGDTPIVEALEARVRQRLGAGIAA